MAVDRKLTMKHMPMPGARLFLGAFVVLAAFANRNAAQQGSSDGFVPLFNGRDLTGWTERRFRKDNPSEQTQGEWVVRNGELVCAGDATGYLKSDGQYGDYILRLEFKFCPNSYTGVYLRCNESGNVAVQTGMKIHILSQDYAGKHGQARDEGTGAIQGICSAKARLQPIGEWNTMEVRCDGNTVEVLLNGSRTSLVDMHLDKRLQDRPRSGFLGISNWEGEAKGVSFRNIRIKDLSASSPKSTAP
jgi:hypothetical protein